MTVFGDYHAEGLYSEAAARAILARGQELPCRGRYDRVRLDPASSARTGIGPTAYAEFERVFGPRALGRWPLHRVLDGLDQVEVLLDRLACSSILVARDSHVHSRTTPDGRTPAATGWTIRPTRSTRTRT